MGALEVPPVFEGVAFCEVLAMSPWAERLGNKQKCGPRWSCKHECGPGWSRGVGPGGTPGVVSGAWRAVRGALLLRTRGFRVRLWGLTGWWLQRAGVHGFSSAPVRIWGAASGRPLRGAQVAQVAVLPGLRGALCTSKRGVLAGGCGRPTGHVVWARGGAPGRGLRQGLGAVALVAVLPGLRGALGSSGRGVLAGGCGRPTGQVVWARGGPRVAASGGPWLCCQGYEGPSVAPGEGSSLAVVGGPLARLCGPGGAPGRGLRQGLGAEAQVAVLSGLRRVPLRF